MKYILSLALLLALAAQGQVALPNSTPPPLTIPTCTTADQTGCLMLQPSGTTNYTIATPDTMPIIVCGAAADGKAKNCKIADGYTLDDAVNAMFETVKKSDSNDMDHKLLFDALVELGECIEKGRTVKP